MITISNLQTRRNKFTLIIDQLVIRGNKTLIIGNNGAGKTTLLYSIAGFLPSTGSIKINSKEINDLPIENRLVSIAPSNPLLFREKTVMQNLLFPKRLRKDYIDEVVSELELQSKLDLKAGNLSSGESQRVSLARCLLTESDLMMFDEPFAFQDQINKMKIRSAIDKFSEKFEVPYIITTNAYGDFLYGFDSIVSMENGGIIEVADSIENLQHYRTKALISPVNLFSIGGEFFSVRSEDIVFGSDGYEFEIISNDIIKIRIEGRDFFIRVDGKIGNGKISFRSMKKLQY